MKDFNSEIHKKNRTLIDLLNAWDFILHVLTISLSRVRVCEKWYFEIIPSLKEKFAPLFQMYPNLTLNIFKQENLSFNCCQPSDFFNSEEVQKCIFFSPKNKHHFTQCDVKLQRAKTTFCSALTTVINQFRLEHILYCCSNQPCSHSKKKFSFGRFKIWKIDFVTSIIEDICFQHDSHIQM